MKFNHLDIDLVRPKVMGIINVTPDSFSDGNILYQQGNVQLGAVIDRAATMVDEGASFLDIGGESTRPGAHSISPDEELARVMPVVEALSQRFETVISVDTSTPQVMQEAAKAGAGLINDVRALRREGALQAAAETGLPVCLMHMQGEPQTMQQAPCYDDIGVELSAYFKIRLAACNQAGIASHNLIIDPGFGFGKTLQHNFILLNHLAKLKAFNVPILVGMSRKSMIGNVLQKPVDKRLYGGLALAVMATERGARIIRTHDVAPTVDALGMWSAVWYA